MAEERTRFTRRPPDRLSQALFVAFRNQPTRRWSFNELMDVIVAMLRKHNLLAGSDDMYRLRAYEKLQNMVGRALVEKVGKEYSFTDAILEEAIDPPLNVELSTVERLPSTEGIVFMGVGEKILDEICKQKMIGLSPEPEESVVYVWSANCCSQLDARVTTLIGDRLELMETIAEDTHKEFHYDKHSGTWSWCNRGDSIDEWHHGFRNRLSALYDAVEPYLSEDDT